MIAVFKTMDVARHVLRTYFRDNAFPLIQHHIDSFNALIDVDIPTFIRASNPIILPLKDPKIAPDLTRQIRVYVGGKDGTKLRFESPTEADGTALVPHMCRLDNRTYSLSLFGTLEVEYEYTDPKTISDKVPKKLTSSQVFENILIGKIPLMLRSKYCYLTALDEESIGECKFELGGYFIIDGSEIVLVTQEQLGNNMLSAGVRKVKSAKEESGKSMIEQTAAIEVIPAGSFLTRDSEEEVYVMMKSMSEDGARGPYSHFLSLPPSVFKRDKDGSLTQVMRRLMVIQIPGFQNPVPVVSIFRALGCVSDRDIYETILAGVPDQDRSAYDNLFIEMILSHETVISKDDISSFELDMDTLVQQTRNRSVPNVVTNLYESLFSNIEGETPGSMFRRKAYALGQMVRMAFDVALKRRKPTDRDNIQYKRFKTSGTLCFEEFCRGYREVCKELRLRMDMRVHYEEDNYKGSKIANLLTPENIGVYWKNYMILNSFSKAFKGNWGGKLGISQSLTRPSYLSAIYHLRETMLDIDRTISTAPPRRLFASQFGILCPIDSPDGSDVGYKKALTVLSRVSVAFPITKVREVLSETKSGFRFLEDVHPSTWSPEWTRVYLNSDLIGVSSVDTEIFHQQMVKARREGKLDASVSLAWMRINNEYKIYCDAGRPLRPVYRESVSADQVLKAKTWNDLAKLLDYIDASESDSHMISLVPFHPTQLSEIHMTFNLSACTNLVPYSDHNPGPRSVFSIAQQKSAASWYHTNYSKRFDTSGLLLVTPQKPLSQTWIYNEIMGNGGCMPYGVNAIVAITTYGGNNQEDSVILNGSSLRRGMYHTLYFHSYKMEEDVIDPNARIFTEIKNPLGIDTVKRKEDKDYSKLDETGIIKLGSIVDETTVLVGHLRPHFTPTGARDHYTDISLATKRGQIGRVDGVYVYTTSDGRRGVKIRIAEDRFPIVGDKMGSRHSQKGTVGQILEEEDMPFSNSGLRPDLIFNPHGIPTRMTVGQFLEGACNRLGVRLGSFVDATPFTTTNRIGDLRVAMNQLGFEQYGSEILYNGQTGEMMDADIFVGPIYYQRLKQMAEDKINYRSTGPKKLATRQPTQGRSSEGGMRIGEMERDGLIAHGMSKFLTESFMERSDKFTALFDKEDGRVGEGTSKLDMPYAMSLFLQELEAMHISTKVELQE